MPWHMRKQGEKWCVYKGTKKDPGEKLHCYSGSDARTKARKYLAALYMHAEPGVKDDLLNGDGYVNYYQEVPELAQVQDRWIATSCKQVWDREGQMVTKEAFDYDIWRASKTGEYPELRLWHVRGFKIGMCDRMERVGDYSVDFGYWYDTPLAQAVKSLVVDNQGKWKVSRGFFPVKATGICPNCDSSLIVGPVHFKLGVLCPSCDTEYLKPAALKGLQYVQTITYDISVTDVPIVPGTAISAWSEEINSKEHTENV